MDWDDFVRPINELEASIARQTRTDKNTNKK